MTSQEIVEMLQNNEWCHVVYIKKDGSERHFTATKMMSQVAPEHMPKGSGRVLPEGLITIYEQNVGWKSIYTNNVQSIEVLN